MVLAGELFPDAKAQVAAEVTCEPRTLLKTIRTFTRLIITGRLDGPKRRIEARWGDLAPKRSGAALSATQLRLYSLEFHAISKR
jgi:hypothetical protein